MYGWMSTDDVRDERTGGRRKRNREMSWVVSPWVNLGYTADGWMKGLTGSGMWRQDKGGDLIARDLVMSIALLSRQQRLREGSVERKWEWESGVIWHQGCVLCWTHLGSVNRNRQLTQREERRGETTSAETVERRQSSVSGAERSVKDYRTRKRLSEVNNKLGRGQNGECLQGKAKCCWGRQNIMC